ncbi:tryptophan synthase subunit alpha [Priestia filamentosa]|uniref:tryptophan synthase subunit alpha n=1 Tax=Priestia filamentosa TaxID=1402861 RepID=UPI00397A14FE
MSTFKERLPKHKKLFIPFITAGDPTEETTVELAYSLQKVGASVLELGVPYSDPLADGPVIQAASSRALKSGMTITKAIKLVSKMRERGVEIPIILFTYFNPVLQLGYKNFFALMRQNQVDGFLLPDLPYEESEELRSLSKENEVALISMVAPTSKDRIQKIAASADGFLYCVSSLGVTGVRDKLPENVREFLDEVKRYAKVPVAVGFGISKADQVQLLIDHSDGIVIGSALVHKVGELEDALKGSKEEKREALTTIENYIEEIISPISLCEV